MSDCNLFAHVDCAMVGVPVVAGLFTLLGVFSTQYINIRSEQTRREREDFLLFAKGRRELYVRIISRAKEASHRADWVADGYIDKILSGTVEENIREMSLLIAEVNLISTHVSVVTTAEELGKAYDSIVYEIIGDPGTGASPPVGTPRPKFGHIEICSGDAWRTWLAAS